MALDTNALFLPFTQRLDLVGEVARLSSGAPICVPTSVLGELTRLVDRGVAHADGARELAGRFAPKPAPGTGDDAIIALAVATGAWVVTTDGALRRRLIARGVTVLFPRDRHGLDRELGHPLDRRPRAGRSRRSPSGNG